MHRMVAHPVRRVDTQTTMMRASYERTRSAQALQIQHSSGCAGCAQAPFLGEEAVGFQSVGVVVGDAGDQEFVGACHAL
jgi:hypothetical protein